MNSDTLDLKRIDWPVNWEAEFGRSGQLLVEIGFGNAQFLVDLASRRLEGNVLGLEISAPSLRKAQRQLAQRGLTNVRLAAATGLVGLWALCAPASLDEVYINFPDPWPRPTHLQRRLINDRFLNLLASRVRAGGRLDVATDHDDYAGWIAERLQRSPYFASRFGAVFVKQDATRVRTKYEMKALDAGRDCYYFHWRRNNVAAAEPFKIPPEMDMPHAIVKSSLELDQLMASFRPFSRSHEGVTVRFIDLYRSARHATVTAEVFVAEEPLEQRLLLAVSERQSGEWLLHVGAVGFPRSTPGVHFAAATLLNWLLTLDPGLVVSGHNLTASILQEQ